jgi:signal transduction histidine kinase
LIAPADTPTFGEYLERLVAGEGDSPLRWEIRLQLNGYEPVIHTAVAATASRSVAGEVEGLRWLLRDVTREKQMQAALVHAGKLSIAGRLAASLAHEINNPLSAALGCAELATEAFETGQDPTQHLHVLCDALGRASRVVAQLREIHGEQRSEEKQPADLNVLVEKVLLLTSKKAASARVEVSWERAENLPWPAVMVDSMQQVFLNLVLNAIEAMEGPGHLNVRLQQMRQPACVGVTFADDGPGIPPKVLEVLFEPFNTTKAQGSGLGLFISQNIVQQHGGTIEVETLAGQGTTFTVWLPL